MIRVVFIKLQDVYPAASELKNRQKEGQQEVETLEAQLLSLEKAKQQNLKYTHIMRNSCLKKETQ